MNTLWSFGLGMACGAVVVALAWWVDSFTREGLGRDMTDLARWASDTGRQAPR
jgi:hypothetical protein